MRSLSLAYPLIAGIALATAGSAQDKAPAPTPRTLSLGVYSFKRPTDVLRDFLPATDALAKAMSQAGRQPVAIDLRVLKTYEECITGLVSGDIDFVRVGPASYVTARERNAGVQLLAIEEEDPKKRSKGVGVIAVKQESPIKTLADLAGHSFAFGDENSTIGRYLSQAALVEAGIHASDLSKFQYLDRHDRVFKAVEIGDFDAGAIHISILESLNERNQLRAIATFDNIGKPWVARSGLDAETVKLLRQALLELKDEKALKALKIVSFAPAADRDFAFVRAGMQRASEFAPESAKPTEGAATPAKPDKD